MIKFHLDRNLKVYKIRLTGSAGAQIYNAGAVRRKMKVPGIKA